MRSFITGSRAYGSPTEESDIDLVILVDNYDASVLQTHSDAPDPSDKLSHCRYGNLNILLCRTEQEFLAWATGTATLIKKQCNEKRPIPREEAIELFLTLRKQLGVTFDYGEVNDELQELGNVDDTV